MPQAHAPPAALEGEAVELVVDQVSVAVAGEV